MEKHTSEEPIGTTKPIVNKWIPPAMTPQHRLEKMRQQAQTALKRKALEIPPPEYDPTIRKKHRSAHALVTLTKKRFITKSEKAKITQETTQKAEQENEISVLSIKSDKSDTNSATSCSTSKSSHASMPKPPTSGKDEESFTDILKADLDVSLEDGEIPEKIKDSDTEPRTSTPIKDLDNSLEKTNTQNVPRRDQPVPIYNPEPSHDFPSYDPTVSRCQKYVPTSEILFDLYCMVRKANQNVGLAMRKAMIAEKLLISKNSQ